MIDSYKSIVNIAYFQDKKVIFWDFDGVIKKSEEIKSATFEQIFLPFGKELILKIRKHNENNAGVSRFEKFPIYFEYAGLRQSQQLLNSYCERFSILVEQKVIDSPWVGGVLNYLKNNYQKQQFFLISSTPQQEIERILFLLKIEGYFQQIIGSPTSKDKAISLLIDRYEIDEKDAVMIGDSNIDYEASIVNKVDFLLCKTELNQKLQRQLNCLMIKDFL